MITEHSGEFCGVQPSTNWRINCTGRHTSRTKVMLMSKADMLQMYEMYVCAADVMIIIFLPHRHCQLWAWRFIDPCRRVLPGTRYSSGLGDSLTPAGEYYLVLGTVVGLAIH